MKHGIFTNRCFYACKYGNSLALKKGQTQLDPDLESFDFNFPIPIGFKS
jgi:hypothetical protein